ncbi:unnamed protein product [Ostreobium quekettii]|uniref:ARID domain-containing protein n=1 Tax=Ostreobium quekettii TaxID=121088 RepID=A0A8S1IUK1_9CHLO|nr:unnamed protein product [Ostreobium quekettii]
MANLVLRRSNNRPLDIFGLYREVVSLGGLMANEKYDEHGRWVGSINFAGVVFPKLDNYTKGNRATSVGNQLLSNYRKFLYDYENAWRHVDLRGGSRGLKTQSPDGGVGSDGAGDGCGDSEGGCSAGPAPSGSEEAAHLCGSPRLRRDALLLLADIMAAERGRQRPGAEVPVPGGPGGGDARRGAWRKRAAEEEAGLDAGAPLVACGVVSNICDGPTTAPPGKLMLSRDPHRFHYLWPVVIASAGELPECIAEGGRNAEAGRMGFPMEMKDTDPSVVPVLVFGSRSLGWVQCNSLLPFDTNLAASLYQTALRREGASERDTLYRRAVKQALQYAADPQDCPEGHVRQASLEIVAERLVRLESDLPCEVLGGKSFSVWHQWRGRVRKSETAEGLASEILPGVMKRSPPCVRQDLEGLLGLGRGKEATVLSVDRAVGLLRENMNWSRVYSIMYYGDEHYVVRVGVGG